MLLVSRITWIFSACRRSLGLFFFCLMLGQPASAQDVLIEGLAAERIIMDGKIIHIASEVGDAWAHIHLLIDLEGVLFLCVTNRYSQSIRTTCLREGD